MQLDREGVQLLLGCSPTAEEECHLHVESIRLLLLRMVWVNISSIFDLSIRTSYSSFAPFLELTSGQVASPLLEALRHLQHL